MRTPVEARISAGHSQKAQRGTPPPPCFAWSPSPINGGGSPGVDGAGCSAARREAGTHRTTTFTSLGPYGRHERFAPLSLTGTSAGSSPAKRGRWRAAPEGADVRTPAEVWKQIDCNWVCSARHAPSTMLRMVPLPHKWGRIPGVDGAGCSAAREKRVRYLPQPHSPHLVPAVGTAPWSPRAWQRPQARLGPCKPLSFAGVPPFYPITSRPYSATPCT